MRTYNTTEIIKILKEKNISLFSLNDFRRLFDISKQQTIYKKIQRLEKKELVKRLIKGKYCFTLNQSNDFEIANFICQPSYLSLETALSFYGIITAFPYQINSITIKKTKRVDFDNREFNYCHLDKYLFWGYEKKDNFLIADKEKALLDYLYFSLKGLRSPLDHEELDLTEVNKVKFHTYAKRWKNDRLLKIARKIRP